MNTEKKRLRVSNLMVQAVKKDIKNIHLGVYPPTGRVRVAAPLSTSDETITMLVASKMPWIRRQQRRFLEQEREAPREYVSGESHFFLGRRYLLNVTISDGAPKVEIRRMTHIDMKVKPQMNTKERRALLDSFYRAELRKLIPDMAGRWERKLRVKVEDVRIRRMKTKWGSCNAIDKHVWLNLELAKTPLRCIDYVLVHELAHLMERHHSDKFVEIIRSALPNYEHDKALLNRGPLGHFEWKCDP
jgi:predicted metal-dependent hydrolase